MSQPPLDVTDDDLDVATRTLWGEARGEPLVGQLAVAWVIRNRAEWHPGQWWGHTPKQVCLLPSQFSVWFPTDPNCAKMHNLPRTDPEYIHLREVVRSVFAGEIDDPTARCTHYEVLGTGAAWAKNREFSVLLGRHAFYAIGPGA